jgi:hypothetical protein
MAVDHHQQITAPFGLVLSTPEFEKLLSATERIR